MANKESLKNITQRIFSRSAEGLAGAIYFKRITKIVVLVGAGISTAANISDFRSPGGIYDQIKQKFGIEDNPEQVFTLPFLREHPEIFWSTKGSSMIEAQPTDAHRFLAWLNELGVLVKVFTQNIDGLEYKAGLPADKVVQIHGDYLTSYCLKCFTYYKTASIVHQKPYPTCEKCGGLLRPDVVLFGEKIRAEGHLGAFRKGKIDCLLVIGTSLQVYPCASWVNAVKLSVPRVIFSNNYVQWPDLDGRKKANRFRFEGQPIRDVLLLGDLQDTCRDIQKAYHTLQHAESQDTSDSSQPQNDNNSQSSNNNTETNDNHEVNELTKKLEQL